MLLLRLVLVSYVKQNTEVGDPGCWQFSQIPGNSAGFLFCLSAILTAKGAARAPAVASTYLPVQKKAEEGSAVSRKESAHRF